MAIPIQDSRALFTKKLIDVYLERIRPKSFLRSFFPDTKPVSKEVSIEVERSFEKVAVDVIRGSEGNRNKFSLSTEKIFLPPLYKEYYDITQLDLYDRVLGSQGNTNEDLFADLMNSVADRMGMLQDKIDRALELQCAQVLLTGIVTIEQGVNIDYKRKAASLVDVSGTSGYWDTPTNDPFAAIEAGAKFLRTVGKVGGGEFNLILGSAAMTALLANTKFQARQNFFNLTLDQVTGPQRDANGMTLNGMVTAGAWKVKLWGYPEFYDNAAGVSTEYIDPKNVIMLPDNPRFKMAHALVPQLVEPGTTPKQAMYVLNDYRDERKATHEYDIQTSALAIPVAVDQIYTAKVTA